jgi:glycosyltransferase involved in cell wall biosynthesis
VDLISIVTACHNPLAEHLQDAYESLRKQDLPPGWEWEWVIQEDGNTGVLADLLPDDPRIRPGTGRRSGPALARNLAVGRSQGSLIKNLDHDDLLTPGVLERDIAVLTGDPGIGWTTSRVLDLLPDGSTVGFDGSPAPGRIEPGTLVEYWRAHEYRLSVHPTSICIRRELVIALGGWMGLAASEDTGLLIAANTVSAGYFHETVGLLYRKWAGQVTAAPAHSDPQEWPVRMRLIDERARALAQLWPTA